MKDRLVTPRRVTFWYGVPGDDDRFSYPNCPNFGMGNVYGFPGIEGRGLKFSTSYDSIPFDPDTDERLVTENEVERAREFLHQWFPALQDQPLLESRVCQYETSVDAHFIVDHRDLHLSIRRQRQMCIRDRPGTTCKNEFFGGNCLSR